MHFIPPQYITDLIGEDWKHYVLNKMVSSAYDNSWWTGDCPGGREDDDWN